MQCCLVDHLGLEEEQKEIGWLASIPAEDRAASSIAFEDGNELNTCVMCFMAIQVVPVAGEAGGEEEDKKGGSCCTDNLSFELVKN